MRNAGDNTGWLAKFADCTHSGRKQSRKARVTATIFVVESPQRDAMTNVSRGGGGGGEVAEVAVAGVCIRSFLKRMQTNV